MPEFRKLFVALLALAPMLGGCDLLGSRVVAGVPPIQFSLDGPPTIDSRVRSNVRGNRTAYESRLIEELIDLAPSGVVQVSELEALPRRSDLLLFDRNADQQVSSREVRDTIEEIHQAELAWADKDYTPKQPACSLPKPSESATILVLTADDGNAYTNVTVAGQDGETNVVHLIVEEGENPLYIFAVSMQPIIWKFDGATSRIEEFVVQRASKEFAGAGVVGLTRGQVQFRAVDSCAANSESYTEAPDFYLGPTLKQVLRRDDLKGIFTSGYSQIKLPSGRLPSTAKTSTATGPLISTADGQFTIDRGEVKPVYKRAANRVTAMLMRHRPGGIALLDQADVIAPGAVSQYIVMPAQAGLLQLIEEGSLTSDPRGYLRIEKTFSRFPSGLYGAHSETFLLSKGVTMPGGNLGHSSVYDAKTEVCIKGTCEL